MRTRGGFVLVALAALLVAQTAWAAKTGFEEKRFQITPFGGWTQFSEKLKFSSGQEFKDAAYIGGRVALRLGSWVWLEGAGGTSSTTPDTLGDDVKWYHLSGNLLFSPASNHTLAPFVSLGGGGWYVNHTKIGDEKLADFEVAAGANLRLSNAVGLRLEARN